MSEIDRFSIVTLIIFFISTTLVIHPLSFHVRFPVLGRRRITIGLTTAPILAIAILWAAQCLGPNQIRDGIVGRDNVKPYNILLLFISLAYMAITLDVTGILQAAAFWVSNKGGSNGRKLYLYFYLLLTGISMVVGNDPVILSGTAFLVYYTAATNLEPVAWLISEFTTANTASMVLFVGNPTNVVICEGFRINNAAFTAYTILPFIACSIAAYAALAFQFRSTKRVPHKLNRTGKLNVREVLRDPVSAVAGSIILVTCLAVIIVVSFFHVDVWKIALPFAVGKFIFDMCWDHYRYTTGRIPKYQEKVEDDEVEATEDAMEHEMKRAMTAPPVEDLERSVTLNNDDTAGTASTPPALANSASIPSGSEDIIMEKTEEPMALPGTEENPPSPSSSKSSSTLPTSGGASKEQDPKTPRVLFPEQRRKFRAVHHRWAAHFPTFFTALPRLPFGLIPFAFSQFILIEGLSHQGWISVWATWLVRATGRQMIPTVWIIGVLGVFLCNVAGTNIGATILLTKVVQAAPDFPDSSARAAAVALAVASNIGAVSFTFSASLAGLLWDTILRQKGIHHIKQRTFAFWNLLPLLAMTGVGLAVVTAMMEVLY